MENDQNAEHNEPNAVRRNLILGGGAAVAGIAFAGAAAAQKRTDTEPRSLNGAPMPEPPDHLSAGPVRPGRGSSLTGKIVVVTGGARGIGRAIAVEMAANGADVVILDIAGPVSPASDAKPATADDLHSRETCCSLVQRRTTNDRPISSARSAA